jgi:iodotyrosine deiodinase
VNPSDSPFRPLPRYDNEELITRSRTLYDFVARRRSVRSFSEQEIPEEAVNNCIRIAGTAPSGANRQPWTFVLIKDPKVKRAIREEAERVEHEFYTVGAADEWKEALKPLGTGFQKPFLEQAPYLVVIFVQKYGRTPDGSRIAHYYAQKSVGIATGFLIIALHELGISTLTYTPGSMGFLNRILGRPENERPFLVLVVGYAEESARVPDISRRSFDEIAVHM